MVFDSGFEKRTVICTDHQSILADKPDRQMSVTLRAGHVPVRSNVNTAMCLPLNNTLSVRYDTVRERNVTNSVNQA